MRETKRLEVHLVTFVSVYMHTDQDFSRITAYVKSRDLLMDNINFWKMATRCIFKEGMIWSCLGVVESRYAIACSRKLLMTSYAAQGVNHCTFN